ncbi:MAG: Mu-like prophage major head subunit gpT family protein, partial [Planctomycetia bacterium]|nr:Mu-like prophage major head subunit gpT family protein [Planctomycetia bacterium]
DPAAASTATAKAILDLRAAQSAEHNRIAQINSLAVGRPLVASAAISGGWTPERTELEMLRTSQRTAPSNHRSNGSDGGTTAQHLSAALMVKAGFSSAAEKSFGTRVMEESRHLHGNSLPDLCRAALLIDGREVPSERGAMIRAALSTGSMPVALGDSANKILITAYQAAPASWRAFASVKPAANFKVQHGIRPSFGGDLSQLPPGGSIKHGKFSEETYDWAVNTFAKMFTIDRRQIIDDDASVFSDVIPGLARAAMRSLNSLVTTTLLANASSFFGSGNSNYFEGALTNLSASSLATAIKMLRQMKDAEGNLLDLQPAVLLVPPELEQIALALIHSAEVQRVATGDQQPTGNSFKDIAQLAVEPRLSDAGFSNSSAVAWYLFSNAMNAAVIVGFLDGMESPTLEQFGLDHDVNTLAYSFRVYHDYGCALADFRAAIRSKGSA